jgi:hypothetical protein
MAPKEEMEDEVEEEVILMEATEKPVAKGEPVHHYETAHMEKMTVVVVATEA